MLRFPNALDDDGSVVWKIVQIPRRKTLSKLRTKTVIAHLRFTLFAKYLRHVNYSIKGSCHNILIILIGLTQ